jgi:hypothetical protein
MSLSDFSVTPNDQRVKFNPSFIAPWTVDISVAANLSLFTKQPPVVENKSKDSVGICDHMGLNESQE